MIYNFVQHQKVVQNVACSAAFWSLKQNVDVCILCFLFHMSPKWLDEKKIRSKGAHFVYFLKDLGRFRVESNKKKQFHQLYWKKVLSRLFWTVVSTRFALSWVFSSIFFLIFSHCIKSRNTLECFSKKKWIFISLFCILKSLMCL